MRGPHHSIRVPLQRRIRGNERARANAKRTNANGKSEDSNKNLEKNHQGVPILEAPESLFIRALCFAPRLLLAPSPLNSCWLSGQRSLKLRPLCSRRALSTMGTRSELIRLCMIRNRLAVSRNLLCLTSSSPLPLLSACTPPADVDAFELLKEDLRDDEENVIATINRLLTVALAIGPKRTRDELLPFLKGTSISGPRFSGPASPPPMLDSRQRAHAFDSTRCKCNRSCLLPSLFTVSTIADFDENNEEAVTAIARQLGDFVEFVGGAEHLPLLFPLLERYAGAEETVIRDAAVESFAKVVPKLAVEDVIGKLLPLIKRTCFFLGNWRSRHIIFLFVARLGVAFPFSSIGFSHLNSRLCRSIFLHIALCLTSLMFATHTRIRTHSHADLATGEWFTNRVSACALLPMAYPRLNAELQARARAMSERQPTNSWEILKSPKNSTNRNYDRVSGNCGRTSILSHHIFSSPYYYSLCA